MLSLPSAKKSCLGTSKQTRETKKNRGVTYQQLFLDRIRNFGFYCTKMTCDLNLFWA